MGEDARDPLEIVKRLVESYRGIKFGAGVVGKTSHATLAVLGLWGIILFRLGENPWLNLSLVAGGISVTIIYFWWVTRTQEFAKKNPGLAMLEGAEFVEYQKWEAEVKGLPPLKGPRVFGPDVLPSPRERSPKK